MDLSASGNRAAVVGKMTGGTVVTGDVNILLQGINSLPTDFAARIKNFLVEYTGSPSHPVPFGGRKEYLSLLDTWLDGARQPPYLLITGPAGRGKSALLAHWCQTVLPRADVVVVFVPVSIRFRTNLATVVFPALAARLAALHGESLELEAGTHVEVWRGIVSDYISRPMPQGKQLLLFLDGVDEAADWVVGPDLFPIDPPMGVRVVVSARLRTGELDAEPWLDSLGWNARIGRSLALTNLDRDGIEDVLIQLGSPLAELSNRADIVSELYRLSEGDPLLVRLYVDDLSNQESGQQLSPEHLGAIPPGLQGYLNKWWKQQELLWDSRKETPLERPLVRLLLKLFAFTAGPLAQRDVMALAELALPQVGWDAILLKKAMEPLNRLVLGDGKEQGYVFNHPRLAFHFAEEYETEKAGIESLLVRWGRQELAALNAGAFPPAEASPYLVQYYGAHLERNCQNPDDLLGLVSDGWRQAWMAFEGSYWGFMSDVGRAWSAVKQTNTADADSGARVMRLGMEVRCALCQSSVTSSAGNLPPNFVIAAVERGLWQEGQALGYSRLMPELDDRIQVVAMIAPRLQESRRQPVLEEVLAEARTIPDVLDKAKAMAFLAPHFPESLLWPDMEEVVTASSAAGHEENTSWVLQAMAAYLPRALLAKALQVARGIADEQGRSNALKSLCPHLDQPLLEEALEAAQTIDGEYWRAELLVALLPRLPLAQRGPVLVQALSAAQSSKSCHGMTILMPELGTQLPKRSQEQVLEEAMAWARSVEDRLSRIEGLTNVAPHLPNELRDEILEEVVDELVKALGERSHWHDEDRISSRLVALAAVVPEELLEQILAIARRIEDGFCKAQALVACLPRLSESDQHLVFEEAFTIAKAVPPGMYDYVKSGLLFNLAKTVSGSQRDEVMAEALAAANGIWDEAYHRRVALEELPSNLSDSLLLHALSELPKIRDECARYALLASIAPHYPQGEPTLRIAFQKAVNASREILHEQDRAAVIADVAPCLPKTKEASKVLKDALATAWKMPEMSSLLAKLAPHLPDNLLKDAVSHALDIDDDYDRLEALVILCSQLPQGCREAVLDAVLAEVRYAKSAHHLCSALTSIAPYLGSTALEEALKTALAIGEPRYMSRAVAAIVRHLPEDSQGRVVAEVIASVRGKSDIALTLPPFASYLERPLLEEAISAVSHLENQHDKSEALSWLAPHLDGPSSVVALDLARQIEDSHPRAKALALLAPHLPCSLREAVLEEAFMAAISGWRSDRSEVVAILVPQLMALSTATNYCLLSKAIDAYARCQRIDFFADLRILLPLISRIGGEKTMADIFGATVDVGKWWP